MAHHGYYKRIKAETLCVEQMAGAFQVAQFERSRGKPRNVTADGNANECDQAGYAYGYDHPDVTVEEFVRFARGL